MFRLDLTIRLSRARPTASACSRSGQAREVRFGSLTATRERLLLADSVEKVDPSRLPAYGLLKTPLLRAATRNLSPESCAQGKDFNLKHILFSRGNHDRLFQQNRPFSAGHGHEA